MDSKDKNLTPTLEQIENILMSKGFDPLIDDRNERANVKFNDADLKGLPIRLTLCERSLNNGGIEFKQRSGGESTIVAIDKLIETIIFSIFTLKMIKSTLFTFVLP